MLSLQKTIVKSHLLVKRITIVFWRQWNHIYNFSYRKQDVSDVTRQYIYYFQWEFWQHTIPIYEVFDCKIFKSFSLHCSFLFIMVISLNYFATYIIQKTNSYNDTFTFYLYRYHFFLVSICHQMILIFASLIGTRKKNLMAKCIMFREKKYHYREQTRTIRKSCEKVPS